MVIANADGATVRADINSALQALASLSSGATEPSTTYAGQIWWDQTANKIKIRNGANAAWVDYANWDGTTLSFIGGGIANVVEDLTPQAGGTFDMNSKQMRWSKGSDIASSGTLTIGTDGNYFDVTGTTSITSFGTLAVGTVVKLHFDAILTLTHHATDLILPGGANITTAAGDEAEFVEYAAGDYRCVNYTKADGTSVISGGGGRQVILGSFTASSTANVEFGSGAASDGINIALDSTYDEYRIGFLQIVCATDNAIPQFEYSSDGGATFLSSNYKYTASNHLGATHSGFNSGSDSTFDLGDSNGQQNQSDDGIYGNLSVFEPHTTGNKKMMMWQIAFKSSDGGFNPALVIGQGINETDTSVIDMFRFKYSTGNIASGTFILIGVNWS